MLPEIPWDFKNTITPFFKVGTSDEILVIGGQRWKFT